MVCPVSLLVFIITFVLSVLGIGEVNGSITTFTDWLLTISFSIFAIPLVVWLISKFVKPTNKLNTNDGKKKQLIFRRFCLITWIVSLLLGIVIFTLELLRVGAVNSIPILSVYVPIVAGASFVIFFCLWILHLIIKKTKIVLIAFVIGVLIIAVPEAIYETKQSELRKVACNVIYKENTASEAWLKDYETRKNQTDNDIDSLTKNLNQSNVPKLISDFGSVRAQEKEFYDKVKGLFDVYSKYLSLFTTYDMSGAYKSLQNNYESKDEYYAMYIDALQNASSIQADSNLQKSYNQKFEDASNKKTAAEKDLNSVFGAITDIENIFSVRCYNLFKISTEPSNTNK
jgi:hypothetical protein